MGVKITDQRIVSLKYGSSYIDKESKQIAMSRFSSRPDSVTLNLIHVHVMSYIHIVYASGKCTLKRQMASQQTSSTAGFLLLESRALHSKSLSPWEDFCLIVSVFKPSQPLHIILGMNLCMQVSNKTYYPECFKSTQPFNKWIGECRSDSIHVVQ